MEQLRRRLQKVTRWRRWVNENPEDAEGKRELAKAKKKWEKEVARCLAQGMQPHEIQGVKEQEGNAMEEDPDVELDAGDKRQEEEPKG